MKKVHVFRGAKGGVGCTTISTGFACWLAETSGKPVTLVGLYNDDVLGILAGASWRDKVTAMSATPSEVALKVAETEGYVVVDAGSQHVFFPQEWSHHLVVDSHYLSLRRALQQGCEPKEQYADLAILHDEDSALSVQDCLNVTKLPLFLSVKRDSKTGRAVDAGLFPRLESLQDYRPNIAELV